MKILALITVIAGAFAQQADPGEVQFKAAMHKQTAEGDLKGAIEQFKKIIARAGANRDLAARALLQLGECYEKLGDADARKQYERVVKEFADRPSAMARAQARLAAMMPADGVKVRSLWTSPLTNGDGTPSPDGRFFSFRDRTGNIGIRDLAAGQNRLITTDAAPGKFFADDIIYSPDGKRFTYGWVVDSRGGGSSLRVINTDGTGMRELVALPKGDFIFPTSWSADGKSIGAEVTKQNTTRFVIVNAADGSMREINLPLGARLRRTRSSMSPDTRFIAYSYRTTETTDDYDLRIVNTQTSEDSELYATRGVEYLLGWHPDGKQLLFTSQQFGTTNAYSLQVVEGRATAAPVLVKRNIGDIRQCGFTAAGSYVFISYQGGEFQTTEVYSRAMDINTGRAQGEPRLVAPKISGTNSGALWSPDGKTIAYRRGPGSTGDIILHDVLSGAERAIPIKLAFWAPRAWFPDGSGILIQGRPSQDLQGQGAFKVSLTGEMTTVFKDPNGHQIVAAGILDGGYLVHTSAGISGAQVIFLRNLATGETRSLVKATEPIRYTQISIDGKRVAYQTRGEIHFAEIENGQSRVLASYDTTKYVIGIHSVAWSGKSHVVFARTSLEARKSEVWRVSVDGGALEPLGIEALDISYLSISPDRKNILYTSGVTVSNEVAILENIPAAK